MNILVIGCNGFIGTNISKYFSNYGWKVFGCDFQESGSAHISYFQTNLRNEGLEVFLRNNLVEVCINAGGSGDVGFSIKEPVKDFDSNSTCVIGILDLLRKIKPKCKYLHISSAAVYGNPKSLPILENQICEPISPYGYHKWIAEIICKEYQTVYGLQIAVIRPFSAYGPQQRKQLLWDICSKLKDSKDILLSGTGNESRDFIHVTDLARLMHEIIKRDLFIGNVFNCASGIETSIGQVAEYFKEHYANKIDIRFSGELRPGDPLNWRADISSALSMGFKPSINLREGIIDYINWFTSNC